MVVVTGTPGAGKSTVIAGALKELKTRGTEYSLINYGDVMLKLMRARFKGTDRDEMRKVPTGPYRKIQREAARRIVHAAEKNPVLVDTHCLVKKPEGYYPGLPRWVLEELNPESIVIIEAPAREVLGRRSRDIGRCRDRDALAEVEEHQQLNRAIAMAYAALTGATVRIIVNRDGKLSEAVKEMVEVLG